MRVATTIAELIDARNQLTGGPARSTVALVPTMGALHSGHRALIGLARNLADVVVVSIFVNPLQFGPDEDYARYPRTPEADLELCRQQAVDVVFVPSVAELYPAGRQVTVHAGHLGSVLEGCSRPGHFDGVVTVQSKLINLVRPDKVIFGGQDAQQVAVLRKMVADLNVDVDIVAGPTVRDDDGLALSSRNRYLLPHERTSALALSAALRAAARHDDVAGALGAARRVVEQAQREGGIRLDYLAIVSPETFAELPADHVGDGLAVIAAWLGENRLIDNLQLSFTGPARCTESRLDHSLAEVQVGR